jgi:oxygen-independent coproporphyrinogen-3 oxidase
MFSGFLSGMDFLREQACGLPLSAIETMPNI